MACESKFIQNKTASLVKKVLVPGVIYQTQETCPALMI